jgi:hypothetical protein
MGMRTRRLGSVSGLALRTAERGCRAASSGGGVSVWLRFVDDRGLRSWSRSSRSPLTRREVWLFCFLFLSE